MTINPKEESRMHQYDSIDDMLEALERGKVAADNAVQQWQSQLGPGDYFLYTSFGIPVFCEVLSADDDLSIADDSYIDHVGGEYTGNYRICRCYSSLTDKDEGEVTEVHIAKAEMKLPERIFERARRRGWKITGQMEAVSVKTDGGDDGS